MSGLQFYAFYSTSFWAFDSRSNELDDLFGGIDALRCRARSQLQNPHINVLSRLDYCVDTPRRGGRESLIANERRIARSWRYNCRGPTCVGCADNLEVRGTSGLSSFRRLYKNVV